jgi:hypothetical protein
MKIQALPRIKNFMESATSLSDTSKSFFTQSELKAFLGSGLYRLKRDLANSGMVASVIGQRPKYSFLNIRRWLADPGNFTPASPEELADDMTAKFKARQLQLQQTADYVGVNRLIMSGLLKAGKVKKLRTGRLEKYNALDVAKLLCAAQEKASYGSACQDSK